MNQWMLSPENIDITTVKDLAGNEDGLLHGRMVLSQNPPALYFDGTDTYIELAGKDEAKSLPKSKLTAEAWVAVNSPAEWGGIVGSLQDNGSFEKGWVLGYNNDKFNFALSTDGDLTYLNASDSFQTGNPPSPTDPKQAKNPRLRSPRNIRASRDIRLHECISWCHTPLEIVPPIEHRRIGLPMKRLAILTAGGDTPALNATLHGAVTRANQLGIEVVGLLDGDAEERLLLTNFFQS